MSVETTLSGDSVLKKGDGVIEAAFEDSVILLHLEQSMYYGGDQVAADIWRRIDGVRTIDAIVAELGEEYDASTEEIQADLCVFARHLIEQGLLVVSSS